MPPTAPPRRYLSLQASRAFSSVLIVLHHASTFAGLEPGLWRREGVAHWIARPMHIPGFFFVLSGIVMLTAHWKDLGHPANLPTYAWKRFLRIYPIYWVVLLPVVGWQMLFVAPRYAYHGSPFVILSSVLLMHIHDGVRTNLVVAWTLYLEIFFYVVFAVGLIHKRAGAAAVIVWMGGCLLAFLGVPGLPYIFSPLNLLFGMGMGVAWLLRRRLVPRPGVLIALGCTGFVGNIAYAGWANHVSVNNYLFAGLASALALLGAGELEARGQLRIAPWLVWMGNASYSIYLVHFPVVSAVARLGYRLDARLHWPIAVWMLLMGVAGTTAGLVLHIYVERPLLKWLRSLRLPAIPTVRASVEGV